MLTTDKDILYNEAVKQIDDISNITKIPELLSEFVYIINDYKHYYPNMKSLHRKIFFYCNNFIDKIDYDRVSCLSNLDDRLLDKFVIKYMIM